MMRTLRWLLFALVAFQAGLIPAGAEPPLPKSPNRAYLSIDYTSHNSFGKAVLNSLAPHSFKDNLGATFKNTIDPLNPARYLGSIVLLEVQKQVASGEGLDLGKVASKLDPAGLAGGYVMAQGGEMLGAAIQTTLARSFGTVGGVAGFALRPVLWYMGNSVGMSVGKNLFGSGPKAPGNVLGVGVASALREYNPVQDTIQMVGDNVGGVIGQALIPIPFVGLMVGSVVGGVTGVLLGKAVVSTGPGQALDGFVRKVFNRHASTLDPHGVESPGPAGATTPSPLVPVIVGPSTPLPQTGSAPSGTVGSQGRRQTYQELVKQLNGGDPARAREALEAYRQSR